ncbi:MAG: glycosyltransferase, partial [Dehalococcoidales bacterium]|nr:glycosyltransferase [Dehalococcoidales bacterium]
LLTTVSSIDYPNFEIVVVDDSTDETTEIIQGFAQRWNQNHSLRGPTSSGSSTEVGPLVKVIHRETREGYKGGALKVALENTDPRAEFVTIFDADFLPYPDTITQFLKYFQVTAGGLDFRKASSREPLAASDSPIAAVQGYQWHVLNKSENWITRGVRSEYAGSYVIERSGAEALGGLKQIAGSVYMIRRDVLEQFGWGTSITEDFELTLRLYRDGWKVVYTPYIQTPSECVSTLKRLIRQRMRWAEGHSHNIRKMFGQLMWGRWEDTDSFKRTVPVLPVLQGQSSLGRGKVWVPSKLTLMEKLEFLYLSPYYLQATFFILGTLSWFIAEAIFQVRLPFWTALWGWSLVFTNMFSLPLMNTVGLFLEESEEKDYGGILSFVLLTYLLVPFQGYAAVKGFLEKKEGPWFRTPKTGKITDIFTPGRFARLVSMIFPGRRVAPAASFLGRSDLLGRLGELGPFDRLRVERWGRLGGLNPAYLHVSRQRIRGLANLVIVSLVLISIGLTYVSIPLTPTLAYTGTFYFRDGGADDLSDSSTTPREKMTAGTIGTSTASVTLQPPPSDANTYYFHEASPGTAVTDPTEQDLDSSAVQVVANGTAYGNQRKILRDKWGNLVALYVDSANDVRVSYLNYGASSWTQYGTAVDTSADDVSADFDSAYDLHVAVKTTIEDINYYKITAMRDGAGAIDSAWTISSPVVLDDIGKNWRPSLIVDSGNDLPMVSWSYQTTGGTKDTKIRYLRAEGTPTTCTNWAKADGTNVTCTSSTVDNGQQDTVTRYSAGAVSIFHSVLVEMPSTGDIYVWYSDDDNTQLIRVKGTRATGGTPTYTWTWGTAYQEETAISEQTYDDPFNLSAVRDTENNRIVFAFTDDATNDYSKVRYRASGDAESGASTDISPTTTNWGGEFSLAFDPGPTGTTNETYYVFLKSSSNIVYKTYPLATTTWSSTNFDTGGAEADPSVKVDDKGGRIDVIWASGATPYVKYNYVPLFYKDSDASEGSSAQTRTVGASGWDYLHFITDTFGTTTTIDSATDWTVRVCTSSAYASGKDVNVRWQIVNSDGITVSTDGSDYDWSSGSGGAQCDENASLTAPAGNPDINGKRIRIRFAYPNSDTTNDVPLTYDGTDAGATANMKLTFNTADSETVNTFYILTDNLNKKWTAAGGGDTELPTEGTTSEQRNPSIVTGSSGGSTYSFVAWEDERNSQGLGTWSQGGAATYLRYNHTATLLQNGKVLLTGASAINGGRTIAELYDPTTATFSTTGAMAYAREKPTDVLLQNGKVLVIGTGFTNAGDSIAELYDPSTGTWTTTAPSIRTHFGRGTATLLSNGQVLVAGPGIGIVETGRTIAEIYDPATGIWSTTGGMLYNRTSNTTTLLPNGKVIVVGTAGTNGGQSIAEIYDPQTNTWVVTSPATYARDEHTATLLSNGKVLVAGVRDFNNGGQSIAELYDPATQTWLTTGPMSVEADSFPAAVILNNGKVMVWGQYNGGNGYSIAELFDPVTQSWSTTAPSTYARDQHTATLLNSGKVLTVGTTSAGGGYTIPELYTPKTADIYAQKFNESGTKQWASDVKVNSDDGNRSTATNNPSNYDHLSPKIKLDSSGNPVITWQQATNSVYGDDIWAQKLDTSGAKQWPASTTGTWSTTGISTYARGYYTATLLQNGKVLVAGSYAAGGGQSIAELYDPSTQTWSTTGKTTYAREDLSSVLLPSGKVLAVGIGVGVVTGGITFPEVYDPSTQTWSTTGKTSYERNSVSSAVLLPNGKVLVVGAS